MLSLYTRLGAGSLRDGLLDRHSAEPTTRYDKTTLDDRSPRVVSTLISYETGYSSVKVGYR
jgi:hypothetical protein